MYKTTLIIINHVYELCSLVNFNCNSNQIHMFLFLNLKYDLNLTRFIDLILK